MSIAIRSTIGCMALALTGGCQQFASMEVSVAPEKRVLRVTQINGVLGIIPDREAEALSKSKSRGDCLRVSPPNWYNTKYTHNGRRMPLRHHRTAAFYDCMTPEKDTH